MDKPRNCAYELSDDEMLYESEMKLRAYRTKFLEDRMSRRELLKAGGITGLSLSALWALACQPAAPAATPTKPVAVAPTPTTAPAAPTPTKPPAPTPTAEKIGKHLIGKLEGPEVITDPTKYPKAFKEAPALADLVKAGKLPAVKERLPEEPLVVKPVHEIGKYGGTWRRAFSGPADQMNGIRAASGPDSPLFMDYTGSKIIPNTAKGWEVSDGGRVTTFYLRKGMKWSDGQPFTADDFIFWFQDLYQNKDLVPIPTALMSIGDKPGTVEKADSYTVRWKFPDPYYLFPEMFAAPTVLGSHAKDGRGAMGAFAPAHYLKQFHPKYVSKEELDKKVKEAKMDNWVSLFKFKNDRDLNPELPVVAPWVVVSPINTPLYAFERNPYSIWVDTEGNQLPYIDKVVMTLAETMEVLNLRAIAGEYDKQSRHLDIAKTPVFLANQAKGGYKLYLDPADFGNDMQINFNRSYEADPEIAKWINNDDFRRALSIGFDRDQINEIFWLGTGTPGSGVPADYNRYFPGPEYRTLWATYDPKKANEMLDKIGLDKKDAEGYRLRTDGKGRLRIEVITVGAQFIQYTQIMEMIREHWKKIGIAADIVEVERSLSIKRAGANEQQLACWNNDGSVDILTGPGWTLPVSPGGIASQGELHARWYASGGKLGKEPSPRVREALEALRKSYGVPEEERIKLGKRIWQIATEDVFTIGVVGLGAAAGGTRIAKVKMGNIPSRQSNSWYVRTPAASRTMTFFWKS